MGDDSVLELGGGDLHDIVSVPKATGLYTLRQFILTSIKLGDFLLPVLSPISPVNILRADTPVTTFRDAALLTAPLLFYLLYPPNPTVCTGLKQTNLPWPAV